MENNHYSAQSSTPLQVEQQPGATAAQRGSMPSSVGSTQQSAQPASAAPQGAKPAAPPHVAQYPPYYGYPAGQPPYGYAPPYQQPTKKKKSVGFIVFICIIAAAVVFGFGVMVNSIARRGASNNNNNAGGKENPSSSFNEDFDSLKDNALKPGVDSGDNDLQISMQKNSGKRMTADQIAAACRNSVVGISVYSTNGVLQGEGSGVVIGTNSKKSKTYILTCAHVIDDKETYAYKIVDAAGKEYLAAIVGYDSGHDIGVLSVEKTGFKAVSFGDSTRLKAGQAVVAVGNPGGSEFFGSVTQGIISATDRMLSVGEQTISCIQHDAAINPGSSGGALFDIYGQVVGINYSKVALENYEGMNFAIPSKTAVEVANKIIAQGLKTHGAKLGIEYYVAASYFDDNYKQLIINSIDEKSDLKGKAEAGDFIIAVNGEKITNKYTIIAIINEKSPGDEITLSIAHKQGGSNKYETKDVTVKLIEK